MMPDLRITTSERTTQNGVIKLIRERLPLYGYIGNLYEEENTNLREDTITAWLTSDARGEQKLTEDQARAAIRKLKEEIDACSTFDTLMQASENVYNRLRYSVSISQGPGLVNKAVRFIDWEHPEQNVFELAEEVSVKTNGVGDSEHRRPDIVVYVNGIALVVLELKRSGVPVSEAIRQNYRNQQNGYIPRFFTTSQLVMAGNPSEGLWYGTTCTPEKYYLRWKETTGESGDPEQNKPTFPDVVNELDRSVLQMLEPNRLIHFIHDCIVYDGGTKKVARPNQFFALQAAIPRIKTKDSGIIWHSQGSGKSLTMVWLAQWIKENIQNARVVIITDRDELDKQITNGFRNSGLLDKNQEDSFYHASSGSDLLGKLDNPAPWLITTLIHKFGHNTTSDDTPEYQKIGKKSAEQYMKELAESLPPDFKAKGDIYVFVDECHRTQGGILHKAMRHIMGENVMMIGFTGTPLLKKGERKTSQESFGRYIHSYRYDEAVHDGVVLDLRYEARDVPQQLSDPNAMDQLFDLRTRNLTPKAKEALKDRWAQLQNIYSSDDRMRRIVGDIMLDMELRNALADGYGNAMLVAESIYEAYKYWDLFRNENFQNHCAVVTSYVPDISLANGFTDESKKTEEEYKYKWSKEMMGDRTPEQYEAWAKDQFINRPGEMKLLIVVDKLLTGFDAPAATYLYLDRKIVDHNLFQAICRVNRVNGAEKEFGYIVDYRKLFEFIESAIEDYTNGQSEIEGFAKEEISEMLKSRLKTAREELEKALQRVEQIVEPVALPKKLDNFFDYFCFPYDTPADEQEAKIIENAGRREDFYNAVRTLNNRYVAIAMEMTEAGFTVEEANSIYTKVKDYEELRHAIMQRSGDYVDMKKYDAQMRALLDRYIVAPRSEKLETLDNFSFLDIININPETGEAEIDPDVEQELGGARGAAETMTANVRRAINRKREQNPEEYKKFSERINRLIEELRQGAIEYKDFLKGIKEMGEALRQGNTTDERLDTPAKKDLCDNLGGNVELALRVHEVAKRYAFPRFREVPTIYRQLRRKIMNELLGEPYDPDVITKIVAAHTEEF